MHNTGSLDSDRLRKEDALRLHVRGSETDVDVGRFRLVDEGSRDLAARVVFIGGIGETRIVSIKTEIMV